MYGIDDLKDSFDWSYDQIRDRVLRLDDKVGGVVSRGQKNKILVSEKGLSLLRKLSDLESSDKSIQNAIKTISQDLGTPGSQGKKDKSKVIKGNSNQTIKVLRNQTEELKRDKRRLEERNEALEQRLLTGEVQKKSRTGELREKLHQKEIELEKMKTKVERNKSPVKRFWEWLGL